MRESARRNFSSGINPKKHRKCSAALFTMVSEKFIQIVMNYELACLCRAPGMTEREMLSDFYETYTE